MSDIFSLYNSLTTTQFLKKEKTSYTTCMRFVRIERQILLKQTVCNG